jgi:hypothetical protein
MKAGFDHVHDYPRRKEFAPWKLRENDKVNLHNRLSVAAGQEMPAKTPRQSPGNRMNKEYVPRNH